MTFQFSNGISYTINCSIRCIIISITGKINLTFYIKHDIFKNTGEYEICEIYWRIKVPVQILGEALKNDFFSRTPS